VAFRVALTFDAEHPDRPARPGNDERLLDALAAAGVRATFFVQGRWAEAYPAVAPWQPPRFPPKPATSPLPLIAVINNKVYIKTLRVPNSPPGTHPDLQGTLVRAESGKWINGGSGNVRGRKRSPVAVLAAVRFAPVGRVGSDEARLGRTPTSSVTESLPRRWKDSRGSK